MRRRNLLVSYLFVGVLYILVYYSVCGIGEIDANKIIHTVYTIARDYRNARIADSSTLPNSDKLVARLSQIAEIFGHKLKSHGDEHEEWKMIEQQLYSGFMMLLQSCQTKNLKNYLLGIWTIKLHMLA